MKKWFEKILDMDFLLKNSKIIGIAITSGIIFCLLMIFIIQSNSNLKDPVRERAESLQNQVDKAENRQEQSEERQQEILNSNLTESFTFEELSYEKPNLESSDSAFLNTSDSVLDSYKNFVMFTTIREGLYFYNVSDGTRDYITDLSVYNTISGNELYYVELEEQFGTKLIRYNIETEEKETLFNFNYNQSVSGIGRSGDVVYYIVNEGGKSFLRTIVLAEKMDPKISSMSIQLPMNTYLTQEGNKVYIVHSGGYFLVENGQLNKLGTVPQVDIVKVKIWNGKPLIYGYNNQTKKTELHYENKVLIASHFLFDINPINKTYLLVNDNNHLKLINKDTLSNKIIAEAGANSLVLDNGDIMFAISMHTGHAGHSEETAPSTPFYFFKKK